MTDFFIGAFNPVSENMPIGSSGAGSKVQTNIIDAISLERPEVKSYVLQEVRTWPYNALVIKGFRIGEINFLPVFNIFFLKKFVFSLYVFYMLIKKKPRIVYFYNTSLFMNLFMFIHGLFRKSGSKKVLIVQDLNIVTNFNLKNIYRIDKFIENISYKLTRFSFDYFVPITPELGRYLKLPENKSYPFIGGYLDDSMDENCNNSSNIAVFAGALEKYNGIDYLIEAWTDLDIDMELHIFGNGSLSSAVSYLANKNNNIIYHGFKSPVVVKKYINTARINFCLRYSRGISQEFFFPSKFFDVIRARGLLFCNKFKNIPDEFAHYIYFLDDDLKNLGNLISCIDKSPSFYEQRIDITTKSFSWRVRLSELNKLMQEEL